MSAAPTTETAERRVPAQFVAFFDDAATFPPGLAPLEKAVTDHVARWRTRSSPPWVRPC